MPLHAFIPSSYTLGEAVQADRLSRGLVVVYCQDGTAYLSWRLLPNDPGRVEFHLYGIDEHGFEHRIDGLRVEGTNAQVPIDLSKSFRDWVVKAVAGDKVIGEATPEQIIRQKGEEAAFFSIPLKGDYTIQKVGIADLDGDGQLDFVVKQPNVNIDPAIPYWKPSQGTYKLEAYTAEGKFLWRYDLGWAIEQGIWYSPYVVYDLDWDGKAEVALKTGEGDPRGQDGRVESGSEYLSILDGQTGKVISRIEWPSRQPFYTGKAPVGYNYASRNQIGIAYLDGLRPHLIVARGTYGLMIVRAYRLFRGDLQLVWEWTNSELDRLWWGQGAHWMHAADVDGDGKDEVILGSCVIDDNGKGLWTTGLGHPDHVYVGDIDPDHTGLEVYYGLETRQARNGMCLVEASTGRIIWGIDRPTRHVHSSGMCSDIDPRYRGSECYSADSDTAKQYAWSRLWSSKGQVISEENLGGFGAKTVYWDADPQREIILSNKITKYMKGVLPHRIAGSVVAIVDLIGDWREEIITALPGELRVYVTTIPTNFRIPTLLSDPIYRTDVAHASMGYYQVPMLSYDMATRLTTRVDRP